MLAPPSISPCTQLKGRAVWLHVGVRRCQNPVAKQFAGDGGEGPARGGPVWGQGRSWRRAAEPQTLVGFWSWGSNVVSATGWVPGGGTPAPHCPRRAFGAHPRVWDGEEMVWMCLPEPSWYLVALPALQELCRVACPGEVPLLGATLPERAIPPRWSFSAGLGCVPLLPAPFWLGKPSRGKCLTLAQSLPPSHPFGVI